MKSRIRLLSLSALVGCQSCATCYTANMINVSPTKEMPQFESPAYLTYATRLLAPDVLDIRMRYCQPSPESKYVCLYIRVLPGETATFDQSFFEFSKFNSNTEKIPLSMTTMVGKDGNSDAPANRIFSKYSRWHEYRLELVPAYNFDSNESIIYLPNIIVSGKKYELPPFSVKRVPTRLCPTYA